MPALTPRSKVQPVARTTEREDCYLVEMLDGTQRWLAVPRETPMRVVSRVSNPDAHRRPYRAALAAAA